MSDTLACAHRKLIPNPSPGRYRRRGPERSVLYQAVQENQETFLAPARAQEDAPGGEVIPAYVEREFRHYLQCGILAYGFARAYCGQCGHEFLVLSPVSAAGYALRATLDAWRRPRRIWSITLSPPVQVRQWVLSLPKRLRWHLYHDPDLASVVLKMK